MHCISYNKGICKLYQTNNDFISKGKEIGEVAFQDCLTDQTNLPMEKAETGDWVFVRYDRKTYHGEVTSVVGADIQVSVMRPTFSGNWKWPDRIFYTQLDIVQKISPPVPVDSRGQFRFEEKI